MKRVFSNAALLRLAMSRVNDVNLAVRDLILYEVWYKVYLRNYRDAYLGGHDAAAREWGACLSSLVSRRDAAIVTLANKDLTLRQFSEYS